MPGVWRAVGVLVCCALLAAVGQAADRGPSSPLMAHVPAESLQAVVVKAANWEAQTGSLVRWERDGPGKAWRAVGEPVRVWLGRSGLGWGRGLHPEGIWKGPKKKEGDGRAPAGVFGLGAVFGRLDGQAAKGLKMPFVAIGAGLECVDDPRSVHYNRLVERSKVASMDWSSSEVMARMGAVYRLGVVVRHNEDPVVPGAGSCIFMHVQKGKGEPTVGCTALEAGALEDVVGWLDEGSGPVMVVGPRKLVAQPR